MTRGAKRRWTKSQLRRKMREGEREMGTEERGRWTQKHLCYAKRGREGGGIETAKTPETGLNSLTENKTSSLSHSSHNFNVK